MTSPLLQYQPPPVLPREDQLGCPSSACLPGAGVLVGLPFPDHIRLRHPPTPHPHPGITVVLLFATTSWEVRSLRPIPPSWESQRSRTCVPTRQGTLEGTEAALSSVPRSLSGLLRGGRGQLQAEIPPNPRSPAPSQSGARRQGRIFSKWAPGGEGRPTSQPHGPLGAGREPLRPRLPRERPAGSRSRWCGVSP